MTAPIVRLFGLVIVLFALLVAFTSRWTVFEAEALRDRTENRRVLFEEERIKRGIIRAADGTVLARNRSLGDDRFGRRYPEGALFAHPVGFTSLDRGRTGLEQYYNDPLTGRRTDAVGALERLLGPQDVGDDLRTTLSPRAQQAAVRRARRPQRRRGRARRQDRAVRTLAATPSFEPVRAGRARTRSTAPPRRSSRPARR